MEMQRVSFFFSVRISISFGRMGLTGQSDDAVHRCQTWGILFFVCCSRRRRSVDHTHNADAWLDRVMIKNRALLSFSNSTILLHHLHAGKSIALRAMVTGLISYSRFWSRLVARTGEKAVLSFISPVIISDTEGSFTKDDGTTQNTFVMLTSVFRRLLYFVPSVSVNTISNSLDLHRRWGRHSHQSEAERRRPQ